MTMRDGRGGLVFVSDDRSGLTRVTRDVIIQWCQPHRPQAVRRFLRTRGPSGADVRPKGVSGP